jgi:hypothetical protein
LEREYREAHAKFFDKLRGTQGGDAGSLDDARSVVFTLQERHPDLLDFQVKIAGGDMVTAASVGGVGIETAKSVPAAAAAAPTPPPAAIVAPIEAQAAPADALPVEPPTPPTMPPRETAPSKPAPSPTPTPAPTSSAAPQAPNGPPVIATIYNMDAARERREKERRGW